MPPEPEKLKAGQRVRIRGGTFNGKYGDVIYDKGNAGIVVGIADHGTFDLPREHVLPATKMMFVTDDDIARRLGQLEKRLLTAQAEIPGMIRELHTLRHELER